uniref:Nucleolar protein 11-like protein n=1 Tax=Callorhinchus milii TaxID=7868 RepID=V9KFK1_CALMI
MARLCEDFMLCGLPSGGSVRGLEPAGPDHVIVTHTDRTVTVYKVSDQKPLGSWSVKQTQAISCPAIYNSQTKEYVVVHDKKVLRIWKDEDVNLEKVFKATLLADVCRIHMLPDTEPLVLFEGGAVRRLDVLLTDPQQEIEDIVSEGEVIRWSDSVLEAGSPIVVFITEKNGAFHLYTQKLNPDMQQKFKLDSGEEIGCPVSFALSLNQEDIILTCLYSDGSIYKTELPPRRRSCVENEQALPRSSLLKLPGCKARSLQRAAIRLLDEAHIAVLGAPHSLQPTVKESLSIWNTTFQTLLTWKELPEGSCGQLWCYSGKLYVPHGKVLTVVPFTCETSSLAAVLGKLQQPNTAEMKTAFTVVNWNALLYDEEAEGLQQAAARSGAKLEPKRILRSRKSQGASTQQQSISQDQLLNQIQTGTLEKVEEDLHIFFNNLQSPNTQLITAQITTKLVHRCLEEVKFYPQKALVQLLQTQVLSYSLCPDLVAVALSKADYFLLQLCLQQFPDIPEAVTCACLKLFLSVSDSDLQDVTLDFGDVACYIDIENQSPQHTETPEVVQNGFSPGLLENSCDLPLPPVKSHQPPAFDVNSKCPVSLQKAALLNEILLSSYSETFLLPHLKDLSAPQVMLFLQYMKYLYVKYSETVNTELPGERVPTVNQVLDWISLLLDAHFTLLVMTPEARGLLTHLHKFVRSQVKFYSELSKIEGSIQGLHQVKPLSYDSRYSIEVIKLF